MGHGTLKKASENIKKITAFIYPERRITLHWGELSETGWWSAVKKHA